MINFNYVKNNDGATLYINKFDDESKINLIAKEIEFVAIADGNSVIDDSSLKLSNDEINNLFESLKPLFISKGLLDIENLNNILAPKDKEILKYKTKSEVLSEMYANLLEKKI